MSKEVGAGGRFDIFLESATSLCIRDTISIFPSNNACKNISDSKEV